MARLELYTVGKDLSANLTADEIDARTSHMEQLNSRIQDAHEAAAEGWGERYRDRVHAKGKWTAQERIDALRDVDSDVLPLGTLVNHGVNFSGSKRSAVGAGVHTVLTKVGGRWIVVIANDNTVASGAWWPKTPEKIQRAQEVALRLRLPVVYLVDCSGLFLPEQARSFSGRTGAGHIFAYNARLAAAGVPQLAGVFGDCIAGGGYMPIISDFVVMTESAYMVIAGAALIRGAKAQKLTSLDIGGPEVHAHGSGCGDIRVPGDEEAVHILRESVQRLPSSAVAFYRGEGSERPPMLETSELDAVFPVDPRHAYDIEDVVGRLVDDSLFHEMLPNRGREVLTCVARISGLWVGIIGNRQGLIEEPGHGTRPGGVLYQQGIAKLTSFVRSCSDDGLPIVWLQDISGFDIGADAEARGLLGYGSNLIYANSNVQVPVFTVLLRKASGAGYYAMSGMPYEPILQIATPMTRLAVMEGRTLAIATYNSRLDDDFEIATTDPDERAAIEQGMRDVAERIEQDMDPIRAASRMDVDEIVPVAQLRIWLEAMVECAWQSTGYRRTKNPRIWSMHDLRETTGRSHEAVEPVDVKLTEQQLRAPLVGRWHSAARSGQVLVAGDTIGWVEQGRTRTALRVATDTRGTFEVTQVGEDGFVAYDEAVVHVRAQSLEVDLEMEGESVDDDAPADAVPVRAATEGIFYRRPSPDAAAYCEVGARVETNQTLGLIEVMKTFGPCRSPQSGTLVRFEVQEGEAVSQGQIILWIQA